MPRGAPGRGGKRSHKGQRRHFTNEEELAHNIEKTKREKEWRKQQGIASESESEEEQEHARGGASHGAPGELPPSASESEESSEEEEAKPKGVSHLIEIENPNRVKNKAKKVTQLEGSVNLSRREREELEKQQAKAHYQKMHMEGKTDEARADLARLALIRKQREEAAKKREVEIKAKEAVNKAAEEKLKKKAGK